MTFDPGWFAAVVSTGALIITGVLSSRLIKIELRMNDLESSLENLFRLYNRNDGSERTAAEFEKAWDTLIKTKPKIFTRAGVDVPPGTRMPEMEDRKS